MIFPDNKKAAGIILARIKPGGEISSGAVKKPEMASGQGEESFRAIAEDITQALEGLKAFIAQHSVKGSESED